MRFGEQSLLVAEFFDVDLALKQHAALYLELPIPALGSHGNMEQQ